MFDRSTPRLVPPLPEGFWRDWETEDDNLLTDPETSAPEEIAGGTPISGVPCCGEGEEGEESWL